MLDLTARPPGWLRGRETRTVSAISERLFETTASQFHSTSESRDGVWRSLSILVVFQALCLAQTQGQAPCVDAKAMAAKLASRTESSAMAAGLDLEARTCAGNGYILLAQDAFDVGRLPDASRFVSAAIRPGEAEPLNATPSSAVS